MKNFLDLSVLTKILDLLEQQCGPSCEIVLHDLNGSYNHTIVDIRNGHVTGRKVGDCGSNLGLEVMRGTVKNGDKFNYITSTRDGKLLRSSTIFFTDAEGSGRYSLCVNWDISESIKFENYLKKFNQCSIGDSDENEIFVSNVQDLLSELIDRASAMVGKSPAQMNKEEKIRFLEYLDKRGAFLISKSGERVCEELQISRYTFYSYLDTIRGGEKAKTGTN